jgi:hypothetical protein
MKITIHSTSKIVLLDQGDKDFQSRVWEGETESGIPVHCFITRIAPTIPVDDPRQEEFIRELKEQQAPSVAVQVYPLRLIL